MMKMSLYLFKLEFQVLQNPLRKALISEAIYCRYDVVVVTHWFLWRQQWAWAMFLPCGQTNCCNIKVHVRA